MTAISDLPLFKMSNKEVQDFVFMHKNNSVNAPTAAKLLGVNFTRTAEVILNDETTFNVPVIMQYPNLICSLKSARFGGRSVFMVKGAHPKLKSAKYFYADDLVQSRDVVSFRKDINDAFVEFKKVHYLEMVHYMSENLPATAKKAIAELPAIAQLNGVAGIYNWLKDNEFDVADFMPDFFDKFCNQLKSTGEILPWHSVNKSSVVGELGSTSCIDFINKKISKMSWSSY